MENRNNIVEIKKEALKDLKIRVFSKLNEGNLNYLVSLDSEENCEDNSQRLVLGTFYKGNPRDIKNKYVQLFKVITEEYVDKKRLETLLSQLQDKLGVQLSDEYRDIITAITESNKDSETELLTIQRRIKIEDILETSEIDTEYGTIDYYRLDELLPNRESIENATDETVQEVGEKATNRLTTLESIQTQEDASLDESNLVSFITYREKVTNRERILSNYIEKIQDMDSKTIIECLKVMEDESENEDSKLYSVYLRIQENRIIKQVQKYLGELKNKIPDEKIEEFMQVLETQKIQVVENGTLQENMLNAMDTRNARLEEYLNNGRKTDFEIIRYLSNIEGEDTKREEILQFLKYRVSSAGQVIKRKNEKFELRKYIEETDFKDNDETEQNWFLYEVSKVETEYLKSRYGKILAKYKEQKEDNKNLAEYETELSELEDKKKDAKELFNKYYELKEKGENEKNG